MVIAFIIVTAFSLYSLQAYDLTGNWELVQAKETRARLNKEGSVVYLSGDVIIKHDSDEYRSDSVVFYEKAEKVILSGHVDVRRNDARVKADTCEFMGTSNIAVFKGNVVITRSSSTITGDRAVIKTTTADIEVTGDVNFTQQQYTGFADYFYYNDELQTIFMDGIPYIVFDGNYAGGGLMTISLNDKSEIQKAHIEYHTDLYWVKNGKEMTVHSAVMDIFFTEKNEPSYALLENDVTVLLEEKGYFHTMNGDHMRAEFGEKTVKTVFLDGKVRGSRQMKENESQ